MSGKSFTGHSDAGLGLRAVALGTWRLAMEVLRVLRHRREVLRLTDLDDRAPSIRT